MTAQSAPPAPNAPFGSVFASTMAVAEWANEEWSAARLDPVEPFAMHPATHVLHYGSACFEGLKAHRGLDGKVRVFRLDAHVRRMQRSAEILMLPAPPVDMLTEMVIDVVRACLDEVPASPGSLYLRPTLVGTVPNIGAAAVPSTTALLYVLASPVGDYFAGGIRPLKLMIETQQPRTTPQFGMVKSGANYVMALGPTMRAKREVGADQVLFAPDGKIQETGAANFLMIDAGQIITPALSEAFLHGVTRDSVLALGADLGYHVEQHDSLTVDELLAWSRRDDAEAALSGTAAVLASVGSLVVDGEDMAVGSGNVGNETLRLRKALTEVHVGAAEDAHGWLTLVE